MNKHYLTFYVSESCLRGFSYALRFNPSNLSRSSMFCSWISFAMRSFCCSSSFGSEISASCAFCFDLVSTYWTCLRVRSSNFYICVGVLSLTSLFGSLPSKNLTNTLSLDFIFIFYLGVLSPCLKTPTTERNSQRGCFVRFVCSGRKGRYELLDYASQSSILSFGYKFPYGETINYCRSSNDLFIFYLMMRRIW
jgi:hypothetical protein